MSAFLLLWPESTMPHIGGAVMVETVEKIKVVQRHSFAGCAWIASWLFTIGFLHLGFWSSVAAIVIWPYYIGMKVSALAH